MSKTQQPAVPKAAHETENPAPKPAPADTSWVAMEEVGDADERDFVRPQGTRVSSGVHPH